MASKPLLGRALCVLFCFGSTACGSSHPLSNSNGKPNASGNHAGNNTGASGLDAPIDIPNPLLPTFPGGGTSDASDPLPNGMICDSVSVAGPIPEQRADCFFDGQQQVAATLEQVLECAEDNQTNTVHLRLTFQPWFVDNTYGANAIGWANRTQAGPGNMSMPPMDMPKMDAPKGMDKGAPKMDMPKMGMPKMMGMGKQGHTFKDLLGSDHAEFVVTDADGKTVLQFKLDYISEDGSRPSGYGSLGVLGGDGKMITGDSDAIVQWSTSLDRNFNERGYSSYTEDSPATDADYTPNSATPEWDYRVVYEAWIDLDAFGKAGFGGANIEFVHASPSKASSDTIEVIPGECPPCGSNPDEECNDDPPPPCGSNPDDDCGGGPPESSDAGTPVDCLDNPEDPTCRVD